MAELAVFSLAKQVLSASASPALKMAYEKGLSIWEAKGELEKLQVTIETIIAVLLDAEKKQGSAAVKNWIKRLKGVLYEAEDLFDGVATEELLKQRIMNKGTNKISKKVQIGCSMLNPIISRNSIANKVKAIRKKLTEISSDMVGLGFVRCDNFEDGVTKRIRRGQDPGYFIDSESVIGRDGDKKALLEMLLHGDSLQDGPFVIAIIGFGGLGKTTLAQLVYNDAEVKKNFDKMWFACISDESSEKVVLGKIFQSISGETTYSDFSVSQLQTRIRELTVGKNFLLVLDDVWDDDCNRWTMRTGLLGGGAKGSRIIVTTRLLSVAKGVKALKNHILDGLSEEDSWDLFKRIAFAPGYEKDPRRVDLGKAIVRKCRNVPLAIRNIASLLSEKDTIQEWEFVRDQELSRLGQSHEDGIMPVLKLSYDHLPSSVKQCFASLSFFPKDFKLSKLNLMYLWIAQGYIKSDNQKKTSLEDTSHLYFMYLLRRGLLQEVIEFNDEIDSCQIHDLIHDLAQHVAGEELIVLKTSSDKSICARQVSIDHSIDGSWVIPIHLLNVDGIRSFTSVNRGSISERTLDQLFANFKWLRTLSLQRLGIMKVPDSIGELKYLRYLDLSNNPFESLPDSMTSLVNLLTLVLECCYMLALPDNFRKLMNLRYLNIYQCYKLKHMPPGFEELTCLQYLSNFKVAKQMEGVERSRLDVLAHLQLRGELVIEFDEDIDNWDEGWQLPVSPKILRIEQYPGMRIPEWDNGSINNLTYLYLFGASTLKYLPPLRYLPNLKKLVLLRLKELEYVEEESCTVVAQGSTNATSTFFPRLEILALRDLPKLKGWRRTAEELFLSISILEIRDCPNLKSILPCPCLRKLELFKADGLLSLHLTSPHLEEIFVTYCDGLLSFQVQPLAPVQSLCIYECKHLKNTTWNVDDYKSLTSAIASLHQVDLN